MAYNEMNTSDVMDLSAAVPEDISDMINTSDIVCAETSDMSSTSFDTSLNESGGASLALSREFTFYVFQNSICFFQRHLSVKN